jgi:hypothetical protein
MPTDALVLDYAPPRPRGRFIATLAAFGWRTSMSAGRWCLRERRHLFGIAGAFVATMIVTAAMDARVVLNTPVYGGCGAARSVAYGNLYLSGLSLWSLPLFWLGSYRSWWASRVARTATVIALVWWLYMRYPMYGARLFL